MRRPSHIFHMLGTSAIELKAAGRFDPNYIDFNVTILLLTVKNFILHAKKKFRHQKRFFF